MCSFVSQFTLFDLYLSRFHVRSRTNICDISRDDLFDKSYKFLCDYLAVFNISTSQEVPFFLSDKIRVPSCFLAIFHCCGRSMDHESCSGRWKKFTLFDHYIERRKLPTFVSVLTAVYASLNCLLKLIKTVSHTHDART